MNLISTCRLVIHFDFTRVNDTCMTVSIQTSNGVSTIDPENAGIYVFETTITLPAKINMTFSGKNMANDTKCDAQGTIIEDKCVIVRKITLDGFAVDRYYLQKKLTLHETGSARINQSNYIGFNGSMILYLDQSNVFLQIQKMARMGKLDHSK